MKNLMIAGLVLSAAFLSVSLSAAEKPSSAFGKKLFNDTHLGSSVNDRSCNTCHIGGKGMQKAAVRSDLAAVINFCIAGPLKGKKIAENSVEMQSLTLYIQSLKEK